MKMLNKNLIIIMHMDIHMQYINNLKNKLKYNNSIKLNNSLKNIRLTNQ